MNILEMNREQILALDYTSLDQVLTAQEVMHISTLLNAFWSYDYKAAAEGRLGMHAILKSGSHSNGFFVSRILLEPDNICMLMADQIIRCLKQRSVPIEIINCVAGIPDGATKLGQAVAKILRLPYIQMEKKDGRITVVTDILPKAFILLVEDFCTRGTGFKEAVLAILANQPHASILSYYPVIINRGGMKAIEMTGGLMAHVVPVVDHRIEDWEPGLCSLCKMGSRPIKPKATDENWRLITTSQLK